MLRRVVLQMFLATMLVLLLSCSDPVVIDEPLNKKPLWETKVQINPSANGFEIPNLIDVIPVAGNTLMIGYTENTNLRYCGLDAETGDFKWMSSVFNLYYHSIPEGHTSMVGNTVYFYARDFNIDSGGSLSGTTPLFSYDVPTGTLISKKEYSRTFDGNPVVLRTGGSFFVSLEPDAPSVSGTTEPIFWISEYPDLDNQRKLSTPLINRFTFRNITKKVGFISDFAIVNKGAETFLVYVLAEPKSDQAELFDDNLQGHINCYNLSKGEWVYSKILTNSSATQVVGVDGENVYMAQVGGGMNNSRAGLRCFNWATGEMKWYLPEDEIVTNNRVTLAAAAYDKVAKVIVTPEIDYVCGIDVQTGQVKWKAPSIGNYTSSLLIHNGVAYCVSGYVYAFDVVTGEVLMRAQYPYTGKLIDGQEASGFFPNIGMHIKDDGKPIIIARDVTYAYAFEGVR